MTKKDVENIVMCSHKSSRLKEKIMNGILLALCADKGQGGAQGTPRSLFHFLRIPA